MANEAHSEREVTRIRFDESAGSWVASNSDSRHWSGHNKKRLVSEVAADLQRRWKVSGELGQLVVHTKSGAIEFERTYGGDPERHRG